MRTRGKARVICSHPAPQKERSLMRRYFASALRIGAWCLLSATTALTAEIYEVTFEGGVAARMRDGVTLKADIYRPKAPGKFPVLLERTPYNKADGQVGFRAAALGYVV